MSTDTHSLAQWLRDYAGEFCEEREAIMIRAAADEIEKPRVEVLTVRQQFVMAAMQGILASAEWYPFDEGTGRDDPVATAAQHRSYGQ